MPSKASSPAATNQKAGGNGAGPKRGEKTAAIRELFSQGVTTAADISDALARQGVERSPTQEVRKFLMRESDNFGRAVRTLNIKMGE